MSDDEKKLIWNLIGELPSEFHEILNISHCEVTSEIDGDLEKFVGYVFADKPVEGLNVEAPVIYFSDEVPLEEIFQSSSKGLVNPNLVETDVGKILIERLLGADSSLNFGRVYGDVVEKGNTLRIIDPLSSGHYSDIIVKDANKYDFNFISIRNYLSFVISYFSYLHKSRIVEFPIEVDYGVCADCFVVQMYTWCHNFGKEYIEEAFQAPSSEQPYRNLLSQAYSNTDILDIYQLEKANKVVMTGIWLNDEIKTKMFKQQFSSLLFNNIKRFQYNSTNISSHIDSQIDLSPRAPQNVDQVDLPGKASKLRSTGGPKESEVNLALVQRIVDFITNLRQIEKNKKSPEELDLNDIERYLLRYPKPEVFEKLNFNEKKMALVLIQDAAYLNDLNVSVETLANGESKDEYLEHVIQTIQKMNGDEADEIIKVKGVTQNLTEENQIVHGEGNGEESSTIVSGGEEDDDVSTRIEGTTQHITDEVWELKKLDILNNVKDKVKAIRGEGKSVDELKGEVIEVFKNELDIDDKKAEDLALGILQAAASETYNELAAQTVNEIQARVEQEKMRKELNARLDHIFKMKRLIDNMKSELEMYKKAEDLEGDLSEGGSVDGFKLKKKFDELKRELKMKDFLIDERNTAISNMEEQIARLQEGHLTDEDKEKAFETQKENTALKGQLQVAMERIQQLSQNIEGEKQNNGASEVLEEKRRLQEEINTYLKERDEAIRDKKALEVENEKLLHQVNDTGHVKNRAEEIEEIAQRDEVIVKLTKESKEAKDKEKKAKLEVKKLEQKIKFLNAQVDEANRSKNKTAKTMSSGADAAPNNSGALKLKVKQLETAQAKADKVLTKTAKDLEKKKKEALQYKTELQTLKNQYQEMERKLSKYEKKAA